MLADDRDPDRSTRSSARWLLRHQGRAAWRRFNAALQEGRVPAREVLDGALVIFGGALLITPGFISDIVGILLLLPPTRAIVRGMLVAVFARRFPVATVGGAAAGAAARRRGRRQRRRPASRRAGRTGDYDVEGTAVDVDPPPQPRPRRDRRRRTSAPARHGRGLRRRRHVRVRRRRRRALRDRADRHPPRPPARVSALAVAVRGRRAGRRGGAGRYRGRCRLRLARGRGGRCARDDRGAAAALVASVSTATERRLQRPLRGARPQPMEFAADSPTARVGGVQGYEQLCARRGRGRRSAASTRRRASASASTLGRAGLGPHRAGRDRIGVAGTGPRVALRTARPAGAEGHDDEAVSAVWWTPTGDRTPAPGARCGRAAPVHDLRRRRATSGAPASSCGWARTDQLPRRRRRARSVRHDPRARRAAAGQRVLRAGAWRAARASGATTCCGGPTHERDPCASSATSAACSPTR